MPELQPIEWVLLGFCVFWGIAIVADFFIMRYRVRKYPELWAEQPHPEPDGRKE